MLFFSFSLLSLSVIDTLFDKSHERVIGRGNNKISWRVKQRYCNIGRTGFQRESYGWTSSSLPEIRSSWGFYAKSEHIEVIKLVELHWLHLRLNLQELNRSYRIYFKVTIQDSWIKNIKIRYHYYLPSRLKRFSLDIETMLSWHDSFSIRRNWSRIDYRDARQIARRFFFLQSIFFWQ